MKSSYFVARTLLTARPEIDSICESVKRSNYANIIRSQFSSHDTHDFAESILDKVFQMQVLHNLGIKTDQVIECLPKELSDVLKLHFLEKQSISQIATLTNKDRKQVYRTLDKALGIFAFAIDKRGVDNLYFEKLLSTNKWIRLISSRI